MARSSASGLFMLAVTAAAMLLTMAPTAHAGAVFEIREDLPAKDTDFRFEFNTTTFQQDGIGSIVQARGGAGAFFASSAIPLAIFTLEKKTAVGVHTHPNAAETLFVLKGKIRIYQFRAEEDATRVRVTEVPAGKAGYIVQGSFHTVENIDDGQTKFLQIFDHPRAGAVFASPALVNLPKRLVNAGFSKDVIDSEVKAFAPLVRVRD